MRMGRVPVCAVVLAVVPALLASACSLGDKRTYARRLFAAPRVLGMHRTAIVEISATSKVLEGGGPASAAVPATYRVTAAVDLAAEQATSTIIGKDKSSHVFDGYRLYGWRPDAAPDEARPWMTIDASRIDSVAVLDPTDVPPVQGIDVLPPGLVLDLVAGALTGSVRLVGPDSVGSVTTTRYRANFDFDRAMRRSKRHVYKEGERRMVERLFDTMGIKGTIHPGEVWLDATGAPRRFVLRIQEEPERHRRLELTLDLTVRGIGDPVVVHVPTDDEDVAVTNLSQFLTGTSALGPRAAS